MFNGGATLTNSIECLMSYLYLQKVFWLNLTQKMFSGLQFVHSTERQALKPTFCNRQIEIRHGTGHSSIVINLPRELLFAKRYSGAASKASYLNIIFMESLSNICEPVMKVISTRWLTTLFIGNSTWVVFTNLSTSTSTISTARIQLPLQFLYFLYS